MVSVFHDITDLVEAQERMGAHGEVIEPLDEAHLKERLWAAYDAEISDLLTDSEGKSALKARLKEKRSELQAILRGAQGSRAVIDGQTLRVGQEHGGVRILAIQPHAVLIERQGQRELLRLVEPVIKPSR